MRHQYLLSLAILLAPIVPALADEPPTVDIMLKDHRFQPSEVKVPSGKPFVLKIKNLDASAEEFESAKLKIEKIIAPGAEGRVRVRALDPGAYEFVGEYHADTARGVLVVD